MKANHKKTTRRRKKNIAGIISFLIILNGISARLHIPAVLVGVNVRRKGKINLQTVAGAILRKRGQEHTGTSIWMGKSFHRKDGLIYGLSTSKRKGIKKILRASRGISYECASSE